VCVGPVDCEMVEDHVKFSHSIEDILSRGSLIEDLCLDDIQILNKVEIS
jgi:hypothetical protein